MATNALPLTAALSQQQSSGQPLRPDLEAIEQLKKLIASQQALFNQVPQLPAEEALPQPPAEPHGFWQVLSRRFLPGLAAGLEGRDPQSVIDAERGPYREAMQQWQLRHGLSQERFQNQSKLFGARTELANVGMRAPLAMAEMLSRSHEGEMERGSREAIARSGEIAAGFRQHDLLDAQARQNELDRISRETVARTMANARVQSRSPAELRDDLMKEWAAISMAKPELGQKPEEFQALQISRFLQVLAPALAAKVIPAPQGLGMLRQIGARREDAAQIIDALAGTGQLSPQDEVNIRHMLDVLYPVQFGQQSAAPASNPIADFFRGFGKTLPEAPHHF